MSALSSNCALSSTIRNFSSINNDESLASPKPNQQQQQPWLIVGLGNPDKKYNGTRHNLGFEMMDAIAEAEGISMNSVNFKAHFGKDLKCPGNACRNTNFHEFKWMKSVITHFKGNREFPRLRIGIGRPPGKMDPVNFFLRSFGKQEKDESDSLPPCYKTEWQI